MKLYFFFLVSDSTLSFFFSIISWIFQKFFKFIERTIRFKDGFCFFPIDRDILQLKMKFVALIDEEVIKLPVLRYLNLLIGDMRWGSMRQWFRPFPHHTSNLFKVDLRSMLSIEQPCWTLPKVCDLVDSGFQHIWLLHQLFPLYFLFIGDRQEHVVLFLAALMLPKN